MSYNLLKVHNPYGCYSFNNIFFLKSLKLFNIIFHGNRPYTSFTFNKSIVEGYGDNLIEIDISGLRKEIQSGDVTDVTILNPKQVEMLIKNDKIKSDFWKKRALSWTKRDSEYLIRGEIPSEFIKVNK